MQATSITLIGAVIVAITTAITLIGAVIVAITTGGLWQALRWTGLRPLHRPMAPTHRHLHQLRHHFGRRRTPAHRPVVAPCTITESDVEQISPNSPPNHSTSNTGSALNAQD